LHILFRPSGALKAILLSLSLYALQTAKQGKNARKAKNEQSKPHKKGGWGLKNEFQEGLSLYPTKPTLIASKPMHRDPNIYLRVLPVLSYPPDACPQKTLHKMRSQYSAGPKIRNFPIYNSISHQIRYFPKSTRCEKQTNRLTERLLWQAGKTDTHYAKVQRKDKMAGEYTEVNLYENFS